MWRRLDAAAGLDRDTLSDLDLFLILGVELTKFITPYYWLGAPSVELGRRQPRLLKNCQACGGLWQGIWHLSLHGGS